MCGSDFIWCRLRHNWALKAGALPINSRQRCKQIQPRRPTLLQANCSRKRLKMMMNVPHVSSMSHIRPGLDRHNNPVFFMKQLNLFELIQDYQQLYFCGNFKNREMKDYMMFSFPLAPSCHGHISLYRNEWNSHREYYVTLQYKDVLQTQWAHQYFGLAGTGPPVLEITCHTHYYVHGFSRQEGYTSTIPFQRRDDCRQQAVLPAPGTC